MHYHTEPDLTLPDIKTAKTASIALQQKKPLSESQAAILLDWVAFNARHNIVQQNSYDADFSIKDASLAMECGFGQGVTAIPLQKMGLRVDVLNTERLKHPDTTVGEHAFIVVHIPIENKGEKTEKTFLIDVTYRQFFTENEVFAPVNIGALFTTEKQRDFAETLMKKGWIELNEHNAKIYCQGFNGGKEMAGANQKHLDIFHTTPRDNLEINEKRLAKGSYFIGRPEELSAEIMDAYKQIASNAAINSLPKEEKPGALVTHGGYKGMVAVPFQHVRVT